jgi:hypothetical protein
MKVFRMSVVLLCLAAGLFIAGCQQDHPAPEPKSPQKDDTRNTGAPPPRPEPTRRGSTSPKPSAPAVALKPATELKVPEGLTVQLSEGKMPRQSWEDYARTARAGQFTEY